MRNNSEFGSPEAGSFDPSALDRGHVQTNPEASNLEDVAVDIREFLAAEGVFDGEDGSMQELERRFKNDGAFVQEIIGFMEDLNRQQIQDALMHAGCPEPAYFAQKIAGLKSEFDERNQGIKGPEGITYRQPGQMGRPVESGY